MADTVQIRISIQISSEGDCDTGLTVDQWNALSNEERSAIYHDLWGAEAANGDGGGAEVLTPGAEAI